jgi:nucleotide-binding universal stress UspA family protein
MSEIVIGIDDSPSTDDALAFAQRLADVTGAGLRLASAYNYEEWQSRAASHELGSFLRREAQASLDRHAASLGNPDAPTEALPDPSPARALHRLAERTGAALIVVGSTHRGPLGRVLPGTTGERLLHGSPCAVAIAPRGYADRSADPFRTVAVGYDGSEESEAALHAADEMARRLGARLRVIRVFDTTRFGAPALMTLPGYEPHIREDYEAVQREGLERAVAALPDDANAEAVFAAGRPGQELADRSRDADLMIVGSRGYGPLAAVMLGGATHTLIRDAACPVLILPRGTRDGLGALFTSAAEAASS